MCPMWSEPFAYGHAPPKRSFNAVEQSLIPALPAWYIIPDEVVDICKHAQLTTGKPMQMRNFLLRGPAGTGKTMGAKAIAAGLNLPYMKYTCSAGTEIFDFVGMIFPDSESGSTGDAQLDAENAVLKSMGGVNYANVSKLMNLPDLDDMDYDPAGVYKALTGIEKPDASSQDCMAIVLDMRTARAYMFYALKQMGMCARAPHAFLPMLLCDGVPSERAIALKFGIELLERSDVLLVCGNRISNGMKSEIANAAMLRMPIIVFDDMLYLEVQKLVTQKNGDKKTVKLESNHIPMSLSNPISYMEQAAMFK